MSCFNKRNDIIDAPVLPKDYDYKAFFPSYKISKPNNPNKIQLKGTRISISDKILENEYYNYSKKYRWIKIKCFELSQPNGKYICIKIDNKNNKNNNKIIIFNNGESSNLCGILPILIDLSSILKLNIITYEYPNNNNNQSLNKKEQEIFECALTVTSYIYASSEYKSFILMGYSTGAYLNYKIIDSLVSKSKKFTSKLKHIINISPMWCFDPSFSKKIFHNRKYSNFISNLIKNTNLKLKIPTFVSHGVKDDKIGYMISIKICSRLNFIYEWYPKEGDHYNILLKPLFRRKLFKRLKEFLSVEDFIVGNEMDNSVISRLTNEGIKVNFTKDLDVSAGNFFFKSKQEENESEKNKINININDIGSSSTKGKFKIGNKKMRKESGFSFLDVTIQNNLKSNELSNNINEINDEDDFDYNNADGNDILNDIEEEKKALGVIKDDDNENQIEEGKNNIDNDMNNMDIFNKVEDVKYDNFENSNKIENKGALVNDSFGVMKDDEKTSDENNELSFGK